MNDKLDIDVKTLKPFTKFIYTIGILPTSYLVSMTYEEQLIWLCNYLTNTVIPTINNNAEAVKEVQDLVTQLQNYINNYFDNLDVQQEINNKLDQMASDGTLTNLIKRYIDPLFESYTNNINTRINQQDDSITDLTEKTNSSLTRIESKVDSVSNGSPLVANSISEMTNTNKIYVNTTDGKWYYYDGNSWKIGGTYQATELADNSVIYTKLSNELQNSLVENYDNTSYLNNFTNHKSIQPNGSENTNNQLGYYTISNVVYGETYQINTTGLIYGDNVPLAVIKDSQNNVIEVITQTSQTNITKNITMPLGANTLYINTTNNDYSYNYTCINKIVNYKSNNIGYEQLDNNLKNIFVEEYEEDTTGLTLLINNAYMKTNGITGANGYGIYELNVNKGEKYKITTYAFYDNPALFVTTNDKQFVFTYNSVNYTLDSFVTTVVPSPSNQQITYEITIPPYCKKIYINKDSSHPIVIEKVKKTKINTENINIDISNEIELNPIYNKTILFNGDSITYGDGDRTSIPIAPMSNTGWVTRIKELNPNASVYGYGKPGTTITVRTGRTDSIYERTLTMYADHPNADYIIIQGGVNDAWTSDVSPLGEISDGYDATLNNNTFSGALESLFKYCQNNFTGKKLGFIITFKIWNCPNLKTYMDRAIEICKKWNVPYLNLYDESNLNYMLSSYRYAFSKNTIEPNGDGCHPNADGYDILINRINNWLKTL